MAEAAGKSVLNLFAYTCGVGIAAAAAGAKAVLNGFCRIQPGGRQTERPAEHPGRAPALVKSDAFAAMRQLSGLGQPSIARAAPAAFSQAGGAAIRSRLSRPTPPCESPFGVVDLGE